MVERDQMGVADAVVGRERTVPVLVLGLVVLVGLLPRHAGIFPLSQPVVFVRCRIYVVGDVVVVVDIGHDIESLDPQVAFAVFQRGDEREAMTVFFSEHDFLQYSVLYFLIKVGVAEAQHQAVGPFLVGHPDFAAHGFVVETVVETFYMVNLSLVGVLRNAVVAEFRNVVINVIVVVRKILESVDFIQQAVLERLAEVDERFVGC